MTSPNPLMGELSQLSPAAKEALMRAHQTIASTPPPVPSITPTPQAPAQIPGAQMPNTPAPMAPPSSVPKLPMAAQQHQQELNRLTTGDTAKTGIAQIHNPFLRGLGTAADVIASGVFPAYGAFIPGTSAHHSMLVNQARHNVAGDEEQAKNEADIGLTHAQTVNQEAIPERDAARNELAEQKLRMGDDQKKQELEAKLRQHGYKHDEKGGVVPLSYDEMSPEQQGISDLKHSQSELADANAAYKKAQQSNIPLQMKMAEARIREAQRNSAIALERLGLSRDQYNMHAHGTDSQGNPLPGSVQTDTGETVGTAFQQNVRPTGTQRDAAGRADTMLDLDARIRKALTNPLIQKGTGPLAGRLSEIEGRVGTLPHDLAELKNDLVSYGAFQAGLHPVRGIGALQYFDKVMGGLGQNPEQLVGKLDSNKATANSVKRVGDVRTTGSSHDQHTEQPPPAPGGAQHVIEFNGERYQYNGSGATDDIKNYSKVKKQ